MRGIATTPKRRAPRLEIRVALAAAALSSTLAACAAPATPLPRTSVLPPVERWAKLEQARTWPQAAEPFVSRGHGAGCFVVDVRVTPAHLGAYRALVAGQTLPVGVTIAAFHRGRDDASPGSVFVLEKRGPYEWLSLAADAEGRVLGRSPLCLRCHSEAKADFVFGPPPQRPPPGVGAASDSTP